MLLCDTLRERVFQVGPSSEDGQEHQPVGPVSQAHHCSPYIPYSLL